MLRSGPWTPPEDERMAQLRALGYSWSAVGQSLGRDPQACANRMYRLKKGVTGTTAAWWSLEDDEAIRNAFAAEKPDVAGLAQSLGRSESAVETRARELRLTSRLSKKEAGDGSSVRRCHDCGRVTHDYRCPACLRKWRRLHGVSLHPGEDGA